MIEGWLHLPGGGYPHQSLFRPDGGFLAAEVLNFPASQHVGFPTEAGAKLLDQAGRRNPRWRD